MSKSSIKKVKSKQPSQECINQLMSDFQQGKYSEILKQEDDLKNLYPESVMIWKLLGAANFSVHNLEEAAKDFKVVLKLSPNDIDAMNNLGITCQKNGKLQEAITYLRKALTIKPNFAECYTNLGAVLQEQGKLDEAITSYQTALKYKPNFAECYYNLGNALKVKGKLDEAVISYRTALKYKPDYAECCNNLGAVLQEQGKIDKAITSYRTALKYNPDYAECHNNLGIALKEKENLDEAVTSYKTALKYKPEYAECHNNLGNTLQKKGKLDEAITSYREALKYKPEYAECYNNLGNALQEQGNLDEAITSYSTALKYKPDYAEGYNNLGGVLQEQGKLDEAITSYRTALKYKPEYAACYRNISTLIKFSQKDEKHYKQMQQIYTDSATFQEDKAHICFALAKYHEDLENYPEAFSFFKEGNALRKKELKYTMAQDEELFKARKRSSQEIKKYALSSAKKEKGIAPIFIIGMPRSGTSLIEQVVSSHSSVHGAGEMNLISKLGRSFTSEKQVLTQESLRTCRSQYLKELERISENKPFVSDKLPHNFTQIAFIFALLPEAKVIHVKRDAKATCWSNFKYYFPVNALGYSYDLEDLVKYYKLYEDLMYFWEQEYPGRIYQLDYDLFTEKQETETKRILEYLNLNWEEACLHPHLNTRSVRTASSTQVRKKVYKGSSQKWKVYEPFLNGAFDSLDREEKALSKV